MIAKPKQPPVWSPRPDAREIGARLQGLRRGRGMSLAGACRASGIAYTTLNGYERGERIPCTGSLVRLASLFAVSMDFVLFGWPQRKWGKLRN